MSNSYEYKSSYTTSGPPAAGYYPSGPGGANTVVVTQPMGPSGVVRGPMREWTSGVCDCCQDMKICLCGLCCSLCLGCQMAGDMQEFTCLPCCVPDWLMALRIKMRMQENIQGDICNDCLITTFCGVCSLCQLAREIKYVKERGTVGPGATAVTMHSM